MTTKRTPLSRAQRYHFTPAALTAFRKLVALEVWKSAAWWDQHQIIYEELRCMPHEWPCIEHPNAVIPHRDAGERIAVKTFRDAQARCRALAKETGINLEDEELITQDADHSHVSQGSEPH